MTRTQKLAVMGAAGMSATAITIGTTANELSGSSLSEGVTTPESPIQKLEQIAVSRPNSDPFYNHQEYMASIKQANPFYTEIDNLLSKAKIYHLQYKTTVAPTFDQIPSTYGNAEKFRSGDYKHTRSFLRVSATKYKYSDGRWRGELTWFWSFTNKRTNKSFVTFNKAETTKDKSLRLTGVFSFLQRTNANSQWEVKYQKKIDSSANRHINKRNFNQYFPKPYWWTQEGKFDERYWDNWKFIDDVNELDKTCEFTDTECKEPQVGPVINWAGEYEWTGGSGYEGWCDHWYYGKWCDKVYMWSSNYAHKDGLQWYDYMYKDANGKYDLKAWISSFYKGYWKKISG